MLKLPFADPYIMTTSQPLETHHKSLVNCLLVLRLCPTSSWLYIPLQGVEFEIPVPPTVDAGLG
jgi:hypothetical protein